METPAFLSLGAWLRARFGAPVLRVALEGGFSCPHIERQGSGCSFCSELSHGPRAAASAIASSVTEQMQAGIKAAGRRYGAERFIAYFQRGTGTFASLARLRAIYGEALADPRVVGLAVATRPDALSEPVLELLEDVTRERLLWVEIGIQTAHDDALVRMGRGHDLACYVDAVKRTRARGIAVVPHVIFGLPGESADRDRDTVAILTEVGLDGLKIHNLYVTDDSPLAPALLAGRLALVSLDDHAKRVADALERIPPSVPVHRVHGAGPRHATLGPVWCHDGEGVRRAVLAELARRGTRQGARWQAGVAR